MNAVVVFSLILAFLFLVKRLSFSRIEKQFGYYIALGGLFEVLARISSEFFQLKNNLPGLHLYTLLEFLLLGLFFGLTFKSKGVNFPLKKILIAGGLLIIFNSIFIESIFVYNSNSKTGVNIFYLASCFYYYYLSLNISNGQTDEKGRPERFFVASILIKTSPSIFYYLFSNYIMTLDKDIAISLSYLHIFGNLLALLFVLLGFIKILQRN